MLPYQLIRSSGFELEAKAWRAKTSLSAAIQAFQAICLTHSALEKTKSTLKSCQLISNRLTVITKAVLEVGLGESPRAKMIYEFCWL